MRFIPTAAMSVPLHAARNTLEEAIASNVRSIPLSSSNLPDPDMFTIKDVNASSTTSAAAGLATLVGWVGDGESPGSQSHPRPHWMTMLGPCCTMR